MQLCALDMVGIGCHIHARQPHGVSLAFGIDIHAHHIFIAIGICAAIPFQPEHAVPLAVNLFVEMPNVIFLRFQVHLAFQLNLLVLALTHVVVVAGCAGQSCPEAHHDRVVPDCAFEHEVGICPCRGGRAYRQQEREGDFVS